MQQHFYWWYWKLWLINLYEGKYMGRVLNNPDRDCLKYTKTFLRKVSYGNTLVISWIGKKYIYLFFQLVVYNVLLYGSEICMITKPTLLVYGVVWWLGGYSHFLVFDLILISALEYIRYMMMYSTDVRIMSTVIYSFCDIVQKHCA